MCADSMDKMKNKLMFHDILDADIGKKQRRDLMNYEHTFGAEITNVYQLTESEKLYQIQLTDPKERSRFTFKPGQFVMLEVPGIGEAPFSISSSPIRHGDIELCIRSAGSLTKFLTTVSRGTKVGIRGPFGSSFPVQDMHDQNVILIGGGLGIAPLRAPIFSVLESRSRFKKVDIVYGAKRPSELLFTYMYEMWRKFDIGLSIVVEKPDDAWDGPVGLITEELSAIMQGADEDYFDNTYAIVCGPPIMFKYVCEMLTKAGIPMQKMFVSLERRMHCGIGKCCRCNVGHTYSCLEGPVFDYWSVMNLKEAI